MRIICHLITPLFLILSACNGQKGTVEGPSIKGTISGAEGSTVYFKKRSAKGFEVVDSAKVGKGGSFEMSNPAGGLDFYFLSLNNSRQRQMVLITDSTQSISFKADSATLGETVEKVEGSKDTRILYEYFNSVRPHKKRLDSLRGKLRAGQRSKQLQKAYKRTQKKVQKMTRSFVEKHPDSPAIIPAFNSLNPRKNIDLLKRSYKKLKGTELRGSPFLAHLGKKIQKVQARKRQMKKRRKSNKAQKKLLKKGKDAPDIRLKNPDGKVVPLSSLEGKVVLIDFWASWCKPCIKTIPKLKKLYSKYKDEGFEIYGVSLDKRRKSWVKAIKKYGMNWTHVSDLKYFNSAAAQKYKIRSIPFTVLVDRKGKIIASGLRGPQLVKKIEEIMG